MGRSTRSRSWRFVPTIQIATLLVFIIFALAMPFVPSASAATVDVNIVNFAFQPQTIVINAGDTVVWTNTVTTQHSVVGDDGLNSGLLNKDQTYSHTFTTDGTYSYHCGVHPSMTGTVQVGAGIPEFPAFGLVVVGLMGVLLVSIALGRRK